MLAALHGGDRRDSVQVIGAGDDHAVDFAVEFIEHLPPIVEAPHLRILLNHLRGHHAIGVHPGALPPVDIADREHVLGGRQLPQAACAILAEANEREVQFCWRAAAPTGAQE
jgi:hypothetical protein